MIATYQDMVSNPVFEDAIKNVISLVTSFGELVDKIGLVNIAFLTLSVGIGAVTKNVLPMFSKGIIYLISNLSALPKLVSTATYAIYTGMTEALIGAEVAMASFLALAWPIAITAGVIALTYYMTTYKTETEKAKEKVDELSESISSLSVEYEQLKSKTALTGDEQKRLELISAELDIKNELLETEKQIQAQLLLNDLTQKKQITGRGGKKYSVGDSDLDEYNKKVKDYIYLQTQIINLEETIRTGQGTEADIKKLDELNKKTIETKDAFVTMYKELMVVQDGLGNKTPKAIKDLINSLAGILDITPQITAQIHVSEEAVSAYIDKYKSLTAEQIASQKAQTQEAIKEVAKRISAYELELQAYSRTMTASADSAQALFNLLPKVDKNGDPFINSDFSDSLGVRKRKALAEYQKSLIEMTDLQSQLQALSGLSSTSDGYTPEAGGGSSSKATPSAIDAQDMTAAFIKAADAQSKILANQAESLNRQIKLAETAKDYTKQIELQNQLLDNQNSQITSLQEANVKIHEEAERIRSKSAYGEASKSWFDANGESTSQYISLLESYAGKTDDVSKAQYKAITDLYDGLYKLKQGWNSNTDAVYALNDAVESTKQKIESITKEALQTVTDIEEKIVAMYEWEKDQKIKKAEKAKEKSLAAAEEEYNKKKKFYEDELSDYQKMIQGKLDAISEAAAEEDFNSQLSDLQSELADYQKQFNTLSLASGTGDRVAQQQQDALSTEIASKQEEIDKLVAERNRSLQEDALNKSLTDYEEYISDKQTALDDSYAKEQAAIEKTYTKKVEALEKEYSKESMYAKARDALISGNYKDLQKLFDKYQKDQGEGWSSLGSILEDEFVSKLREAADLLAELDEGGISTSRLIKAISGSESSGSGSTSGSTTSKSHTTLGGGFENMSDSKWATYLYNKKLYAYSTDEATRKIAAAQNNEIRADHGIKSDKYSYEDVKNYYASGTKSAAGGLAMVGENGAELRVLDQGDGIIPSNITDTLMSFAKNPASYVSRLLYNTAPTFNVNTSPLTIGNLVNIEGNVTDDSKVAEITRSVKDEVGQIYKYINKSKANIGFGY